MDALTRPIIALHQVSHNILATGIGDLTDEDAKARSRGGAGPSVAWTIGLAKNPVGGWYGRKKGLPGRFAMYVPPLMEALGLAEVKHNPRNNRMRAI